MTPTSLPPSPKNHQPLPDAQRLAEITGFLAFPAACWNNPERAEEHLRYLLAAHDALATELQQAREEAGDAEVEKLRLLQELDKRDKGENAAIWCLTRKITDTFQAYGKKFGGPAAAHDKRFWASIEDEWYDDIKAALWPTREDVFAPFVPAAPAPAGAREAGGEEAGEPEIPTT